MMNNNAGLIIVKPESDRTEYAAIYRVVGMAGDSYLADPATLGRDDRIESKREPLEHFSPYDHHDYVIFASEEAAVPYILDMDSATHAAREELATKSQDAPKPQPVQEEPQAAAVNDNQPVPDHNKLDEVVSGNKLLVKAVAAIREARGTMRAHDLVRLLDIESAKARYLVHTLAELGFGEIAPFHTIHMPDRFLGPGNTVRDVMDRIAL